MKTVKFYTLGCKVNQYETQNIREYFERSGFKEFEDGRPSDFYVINTCTVTQRADRESLNLIRQARRENPKAKIIVTGCLVELDSHKIYGESGVSFVVRNQHKEQILNLINEPTSQGANVPMKRGISYFKDHSRAFLKIQDGCNNFCSYCKVPLVRGRSRSKPLDEIMSEAEQLVENGYKEIVLTGICLGLYGKELTPKLSLVEVIESLQNLEGLYRIRLSSIEAGDISDTLIHLMAESKKLCPHLHIPIQSGDDEILKKMNRKSGSDDYLNLVGRLRRFIPEIAITTDCIVGFPGETEINFKNTLRLVQKIMPLKVHIFPYSERVGTSADNFMDKVNSLVIKERIKRLKSASLALADKYKKQFLNQNMDVLIENGVKGHPEFWQGHTDNYIKVIVKSEKNLKNKIIPLRLKKIFRDTVLAVSVV